MHGSQAMLISVWKSRGQGSKVKEQKLGAVVSEVQCFVNSCHECHLTHNSWLNCDLNLNCKQEIQLKRYCKYYVSTFRGVKLSWFASFRGIHIFTFVVAESQAGEIKPCVRFHGVKLSQLVADPPKLHKLNPAKYTIYSITTTLSKVMPKFRSEL